MSEIRYSRGLGLREVIVRGLGVMVIVTAFVLLGDGVAAAGTLTPLSFVLALLLLLANLLGYSELALRGARRGGAYTQVHEARGGWLAFFTGWSLVLSGLGLSALLARGLAVHVTVLLGDHLDLSFPVWPWAMGFVLLLGLSNAYGTRDGWRGLFPLVMVVVLLLGFTLLAVPHIDAGHFAGGPRHWRQALTLLMALFVGLEVTTTLQNEMDRQARTTLVALLVTPSLAALLGALLSLVVVGVLGPAALARSGPSLALLGSEVASGAGRPLILAVGAFALALALNSTFVLVVRQTYAMSKDGYWPDTLRHMHRRFGTAVWIIVLVAAALLLLTLLPADLLSQVTGLLYLLVLMAVNLALVLGQQSETSPFRLPFHPWIPGLALVIDVLVLFLWGPIPLAGAAGCLALGATLYLAHARGHHIRAQEGVTVFKPPSGKKI